MSVNEVVQSYDAVKSFARVQKAIEFKEAYRAETGHRPSLVSVIALYQEYKARAEVAEALAKHLQSKIDAQEDAGGPL